MPDDIDLTVRMPDGERRLHVRPCRDGNGTQLARHHRDQAGIFHVALAGASLKQIEPSPVGILGTSLSAIDALITVATAHGAFFLDSAGQLQYQGAPGTENFRATMMSRKGLLPEADFYCEYPYAPLRLCTEQAVDALIERGSANLLDDVFESVQA